MSEFTIKNKSGQSLCKGAVPGETSNTVSPEDAQKALEQCKDKLPPEGQWNDTFVATGAKRYQLSNIKLRTQVHQGAIIGVGAYGGGTFGHYVGGGGGIHISIDKPLGKTAGPLSRLSLVTSLSLGGATAKADVTKPNGEEVTSTAIFGPRIGLSLLLDVRVAGGLHIAFGPYFDLSLLTSPSSALGEVKRGEDCPESSPRQLCDPKKAGPQTYDLETDGVFNPKRGTVQGGTGASIRAGGTIEACYGLLGDLARICAYGIVANRADIVHGEVSNNVEGEIGGKFTIRFGKKGPTPLSPVKPDKKPIVVKPTPAFQDEPEIKTDPKEATTEEEEGNPKAADEAEGEETTVSPTDPEGPPLAPEEPGDSTEEHPSDVDLME